MSVIVKAAEVVGSTIAGQYGAWSLTELASFLQGAGNFPTYESAWQAVVAKPEYWYNRVASFEASSNPVDYAVLRRISGGAADAVSSTTETALEVAQSNTLTASTSEISVANVAVGDVSGGAGSSFGLKALLQADVGIMSAAMAPVLGVSLGASLYESNPELWTKISQTLLPFCYEDSTMMPFWGTIDAIGNWETSVCRDVVEALRNLFEEEAIGPSPSLPWTNPPGVEGTYYFNPVKVGPIKDGGKITQITGNPIAVGIPTQSGLSQQIISFTQNDSATWARSNGSYPFTQTATNPYTYNGVTIYHSSTIYSPTNYYDLTPSTGTFEDAYKTIIGGEEGANYPEGTSKWNGSAPSSTIADPIIDEDGNPVDTTPFSMPYNVPDNWTPGLPAPSADPTAQPDPSATTDPNKQISPYIAPMPVPWDTVYPQPSPTVDPESNPSVPTPPKQSLIDAVPLPPAPTGSSPFPNMPTTSTPFSSNVGLVTVYHPTDAELYAFESWLWVTYADATIDKIWNNPFDGIITLFELYCTPTDIGNRNIHSGFLDSGVNSAIISRYTEIDCGSLGIPEWYGNYLDYSPYTKAHIYLPFIGIQELNPDDIVGHGVNVTYRIDEYNGSCIAMITVAKATTLNGEEVEYSNTMYQFSGNCAVELPITGGSQASIKAGMMQADAYQMAGLISTGANLLGGIGSALMGNLGGAIAGVGGAASSYGYTQASYLSNMLSGKSTVQKSGSFGASHGALGIKTPFITITRPKQIQVANYEKLYGYPAHKMVTIGDCTGFLRCREVNVVSATANDEEKALIEQLLKTGVYVTE